MIDYEDKVYHATRRIEELELALKNSIPRQDAELLIKALCNYSQLIGDSGSMRPNTAMRAISEFYNKHGEKKDETKRSSGMEEAN